MTALVADLAAAVDPTALARKAHIEPDPWQQAALRSSARQQLWLCCRGAGKSMTAAILAVHTAAYTPGSTVLLVSPSQRQSDELMGKVKALLRYIDRPESDAVQKVVLTNGSRIISLPGGEHSIRGFHVNLVIIDEAARVEDETYAAVRPMLLVTRGRLVALSTPHGARGWFHEAWTEGGPAWERTKVTADDVPRISAADLERERAAFGQWLFRQEFYCEFVNADEAMWTAEQIERMFSGGW